LRENIFREVVATLLCIKECLGGEATRFIIEKPSFDGKQQ
jgi:hypothetical protein